jgi:hypothetical protein
MGKPFFAFTKTPLAAVHTTLALSKTNLMLVSQVDWILPD